MKPKSRTKIQFVVDPQLISKDQSELLVRLLQEEKIRFVTNYHDLPDDAASFFFVEKKNLRKISRFKNKMIVVPASEEKDPLPFSTLNFSSYEDITHFMEQFFMAEKNLHIKQRLRESERLYDQIRAASECGDPKNLSEDSRRNFEMILDLEMLLLQEESVEEWNTHFKSFLKKNGDITALSLLKSEDFLKEEGLSDDNGLLYKLPYEDYYLFLRFKLFDLKKDAEVTDLLLTTVLRSLQVLDQKLVKNDGEIDFWKKIFAKIPYPMAVISSLGDLLIYNESFAKIGILPKECLRYKDLESSEIFQQFYKIRRIDFPINLIHVSYFIFYTSDKDQLHKAGDKVSRKNSSIDELGIISSSIAHELNNPLAGILAAISLLHLEDDWSKDALSDLDDMKNGARRCKELVEIFLGFSKFSTAAQSKVSIKDSLDQAINLLRFRMIESNLRLEMKYSPTLEQFSHQINASIMSMILYLICGELMTAFAHHRLITGSHHGVLSGEVLEFSNQIVLRIDEDFEYEEKIAQAKLIQHLLIFEKLEISFLKQEIRLIYRL